MRLDSCYIKNTDENKKEYPYVWGRCFTPQLDDKSTSHFLMIACPVGEKERIGGGLTYIVKEIIKELKC